MKTDTEADVRTDTAIRVAAIFFVAIMFLAFTTDPIRTGTKEGDRAPPLTGMAYNGSGWTNFDMSDYIDTNWTAGDTDGQWLWWISSIRTARFVSVMRKRLAKTLSTS